MTPTTTRDASAARAVPCDPHPAGPPRSAGRTLGSLVVAGAVAAIVAAAVLLIVRHTHFPAFTTSNMTRALTTVAQVVTLAIVAAGVLALRRNALSRGGRVLAWAGLSAFSAATLAIPLSATRLYLFGVSVDQEFRTQFLTRTAATPGLPDMNYADLPSYYPSGWFWVGGRLADALSMPGWEMFKPYAIGSLTVAIVVSAALWSRIVRPDHAVLVGAAQAVIVLAYGSPESYGAIVAVLIPPVAVLAWSGLRARLRSGAGSRIGPDGGSGGGPDGSSGGSPDGVSGGGRPRRTAGWAAIGAVGVFLGISACIYTLYTAYAAFTVVIMALAAAAALLYRGMRASGTGTTPARVPTWPLLRTAASPLLRVLAAGIIAGLLALLVWAPYLLYSLRHPGEAATARHYLPQAGSVLPLPMFNWSLLGALTLLGLLWLLLRFRDSVRAQALGIAVAALYAWVLLSMAWTVLGSTLLGFRLEPVLLLLLGAAGTFCIIDLARWAVDRVRRSRQAGAGAGVGAKRARQARTVITAVGVIAAVMFAQNIPDVLSNEISVAYSDTDGYGERADGYPPGAAAYYGRLDDAITAQVDTPRNDTVVLATDFTFLSYYPYLGFQALTSHYANPLGDFDARNAAIERWTRAAGPQELLRELDDAPWRTPQAFVLRRSADGYTLRMSSDVYPNDPNVKKFTVTFDESLFDDPAFTRTDIGPFTLIVRTPQQQT